MLCFGRLVTGESQASWVLIRECEGENLESLTAADSAAIARATRDCSEMVLRDEDRRALWRWRAGTPLGAVGGEAAVGAERGG